jgi:hypothetical protein
MTSRDNTEFAEQKSETQIAPILKLVIM